MENEVTFFTAFLAGLGSFLAPCVLPMMPTYAALLAGSDPLQAGRRTFIFNSAAFLGGFTVVFITMGATASFFGQFFFDHQVLIRKLGAVFMVIMGLHLLGAFTIAVLHREYKPLQRQVLQGPGGAFLLGIAFTAGWTPCTGPILASILIYASAAATLSQGALLLFVYSLGFSIPFIIIAALCNRYLTQIKSFYRWLPFIHRLAGILLVVTGIVIYFDLLSKVTGYLLT